MNTTRLYNGDIFFADNGIYPLPTEHGMRVCLKIRLYSQEHGFVWKWRGYSQATTTFWEHDHFLWCPSMFKHIHLVVSSGHQKYWVQYVAQDVAFFVCFVCLFLSLYMFTHHVWSFMSTKSIPWHMYINIYIYVYIYIYFLHIRIVVVLHRYIGT